MKRIALVFGMLVVLILAGVVTLGILERVDAAVTTNTTIGQNITKDGVINLLWDFVADAAGAAVVRTKFPVQGQLIRGVYVPDATHQGQGATTAGLTVRPVTEQGGVWYEGAALDSSVVTFTTDGLSVVSYWPAGEVVSTTELQVEITGALTDDAGGARGRLWLMLLPRLELGE